MIVALSGSVFFDIIVLNDMLSYETEDDLFSDYKNKFGRYYEDYMKDRLVNA